MGIGCYYTFYDLNCYLSVDQTMFKIIYFHKVCKIFKQFSEININKIPNSFNIFYKYFNLHNCNVQNFNVLFFNRSLCNFSECKDYLESYYENILGCFVV